MRRAGGSFGGGMSAATQFLSRVLPQSESNHEYDYRMRQTVTIIVGGTILWALALVIEIARKAPTNALWICVSGIVMGLIGLRYSIRRLRRERRS
jgi:hypothetical protein